MNFLEVYCREIQKQCEFTIMAFDDIQKYLHKNEDLIDKTNQDLDKNIIESVPQKTFQDLQKYQKRIWYSIQSFLVASANISKIFWPNKRDNRDKSAKELRKLLNIDNNSILNNRNFRNHFEHFDERIEKWVLNSKEQNFADLNISNIPIQWEHNHFRNYDIRQHKITFQGEEYFLLPILDEILQLNEKVSKIKF